jgi:hypothetical protein
MDESNALRWFRVEADFARNIAQTEGLRQILGENYQPRYERLLNSIPFEELKDIQTKPLGHGKYGAVLAATWHRPRSIEHKQPKAIPVVLKRILTTLKMSERQKLRKFFHEVHLNTS